MRMATEVERAHGLYREGKHEEALGLYSQALKELEGEEEEEVVQESDSELKRRRKMLIALHSNRAACLLKMRRFREAAEECSAVLELEQEHAGALMLRAQTLVTLRDYHSALFDVDRLLRISPQSRLYHDLHARLKTQLSLAPIPESEEEEEEDEAAALRQAQPAVLHEHQHQQTQQPPSSSHPSTVTPWETIPKPKGHSGLDYSRWDQVPDASSSSEDESDHDDHDDHHQFRFRLRTVGIRPVK